MYRKECVLAAFLLSTQLPAWNHQQWICIGDNESGKERERERELFITHTISGRNNNAEKIRCKQRKQLGWELCINFYTFTHWLSITIMQILNNLCLFTPHLYKWGKKIDVRITKTSESIHPLQQQQLVRIQQQNAHYDQHHHHHCEWVFGYLCDWTLNA